MLLNLINSRKFTIDKYIIMYLSNNDAKLTVKRTEYMYKIV